MTFPANQISLTTRAGLHISVRPAGTSDETLLEDFFHGVSEDDLRFRFLSAMPRVPHSEIVAMTRIDHRQTENFLAFDEATGQLIATAMLGCDAKMETGEVAIAIRSGFKNRGIGWTLLGYVTDVARGRGLRAIESVESRDNHAAIELEREAGFVAQDYEGDPSLVLVRKPLAAA